MHATIYDIMVLLVYPLIYDYTVKLLVTTNVRRECLRALLKHVPIRQHHVSCQRQHVRYKTTLGAMNDATLCFVVQLAVAWIFYTQCLFT